MMTTSVFKVFSGTLQAIKPDFTQGRLPVLPDCFPACLCGPCPVVSHTLSSAGNALWCVTGHYPYPLVLSLLGNTEGPPGEGPSLILLSPPPHPLEQLTWVGPSICPDGSP